MGTSPDRLPLVIGVTGHRDLRTQDIPLLEREIDAVIVRLLSDYLGDDTKRQSSCSLLLRKGLISSSPSPRWRAARN